MNQPVRVRFAPSPTGMLHIGAVRTALFCYLLARQQKGKFILRIEDTDKAREVEGARENIEQSLKWLGLDWDEEYVQSEHLSIYREHGEALIEKGLAYADPYTPSEVEQFRHDAKAKNRPFLFRDFRPEDPPHWDSSMPLRFRVPEIKDIVWHDEVRGKLSAGPAALDDIVLIKSDGYPTYNFAHIVDDYLLKISHVLRGEEFIASTPNYLAIYEAFGWRPPKFVTVPLIQGSGGTKKLSKREGAQAVLDYKEEGYLADALNNFLALLGWNDGSEQEIFTKEELIEKFSIERIQKSPAKFDIERLQWINAQHLRQLSSSELFSRSARFWPEQAKNASDELKQRILEVERERIKTLGEISELPSYFFEPPNIASKLKDLATDFNNDIEEESFKGWLREVAGVIKKVGDQDRAKLEAELRERVGKHPGKAGTLFSALRIVLTDADRTPPIWDLVYILGKDEAAKRLSEAAK